MSNGIKRFLRLRGNIKNSFDDELGGVTLWTGPNMSGKTGRLQAAKIAIMGPGGNSGGVKGSDLMRLAAPKAVGLYAGLVGPDGSCEIRVQTEGGKAKQPEWPIFEGKFKDLTDAERANMMPMVSMGDLLDLGPDRGRRALVQRFGNVSSVPRPPALLEEQAALWDTGLETVRANMPLDADASELLAALNKWFNNTKLERGRQLKALEASLDERRDTLNTEGAGAEMLDDLNKDLETAEAWERAAGTRARLAQIELQKAEYREKAKPFKLADDQRAQRDADAEARRVELKAVIKEAEAAFDKAQADVADQEGRLTSGKLWQETLERAQKMIEKGAEAACPLCTTKRVCFTADGQHDEWELFDPSKVLSKRIMPAVTKRAESIQAARKVRASAEVKVALARGELAKFEQQLSQARNADTEARNRLKAEAHRIQAVEFELQNLLKESNAPLTYAGPTSQELKAQINGLGESARARRQVEEETARLRKVEAERDLAKKLEIESKKLLAQLIRDVKSTAEASVNRYIVPGKKAEIDLEKNAWNVLDVHGQPRGKFEMCGFEKCSLVPALAGAYTEGSPARYLVLDDDDLRGFSRANLIALMQVLVKAIEDGLLTQVFMAHSWLVPEDAPVGVTVHALTLPDGVEEPNLMVAPAPSVPLIAEALVL